ncbi:MAG: histidine kinase [Rhodothermaceae bacterium]|nr:MAG: histidine kinase [Rhodothermaceae bacterium]
MNGIRARTPSRVYRIIGGVLGALLLATWIGRDSYVARVRATVPARQEAEVHQALARVERNFAEIQAQLLAQARALAEAPAVVQGFRRLQQGERPGANEALVRYLAAFEQPRHIAVELYDPTPLLLAWNGFSMPLDAAPSSPRFLEAVQTAVVQDAGKRAALVVWWPVRDGMRPLGAVRVMRLIHFDAPVRNRYLRDYSLDDEWTRAVRLPVHVAYDVTAGPGATEEGRSRLLQGIDGTPLARVRVEPPPAAQLIADARARFDDLIVLWVVLLGFWVVAGLWQWYRALWTPGEPAPVHREAPPPGRLLVRFGIVALAWWAWRYGLLALNAPGRWQAGKAPLAPLFDPQHLASTYGGGLMRSTGDLLLTACFALCFALGLLHLAMQVPATGTGRAALRGPRLRDRLHRPEPVYAPLVRLFASTVGVVALAGLLVFGLGGVVRHAILDSTLDYFARTGLLPGRLALLVYIALLLLTLAVLLAITGVMRLAPGAVAWIGPFAGSVWHRILTSVLAVVVSVIGLYLFVPGAAGLVPWTTLLAFLVLGAGGAVFLVRHGLPIWRLLAFRSVLPQVFLLALLLYPLLYGGFDAQRRVRMQDAAEAFEEGNDPRIYFAIEQVLQKASWAEVSRALVRPAEVGAGHPLDSLAAVLLEGSLLASLGGHDVSLTLFDGRHRPRGRARLSSESMSRTLLDEADSLEFDLLHAMYTEARQAGPFIEKITGRRQQDRFQYAGIAPVRYGPDSTVAGWMLVRAEPRPYLREGYSAFPQVLLPAGLYGSRYAGLSLAEFRDGVLVRSQGRGFGRYRLDDAVQQALLREPLLWRYETVKEQSYLTLYARVDDPAPEEVPALPGPTRVVAVRTASINVFDHLYFLLRLTLAGLFIGVPVYLGGLYGRRRAGYLPAPRVAFREKVLNAFFVVGIVTATAMGYTGLKVVTGENERAIQSWLQQHLERVEATLARQARGDELPYRVLDRIRIDSLALQVGLDLNVYKDARLTATSRPQLLRDRLIDERLPASAYQALYFDGFRFTSSEEEVGSFAYTAGYRALPDERGVPRYVLSVPTLPEQERIEEERARTVAYLFGALLLLVLVVVLTAGLLARALARPIARLREGLEAVARGRFERIPPVKTRDEIGELVESFNEMQAQLSESRQRLAQQERQLAWREMARQVAHEIKNPLTPMKLSVQHLQRAFEDLLGDGRTGPESDSRLLRFGQLLQNKTGTLLEQIDALKRIADEFSSFARMPTRMLEPLDLNAIIREAVDLMQEEADFTLELDLHPAPLVLEADREELRRIYINLIKNALQAIPEGTSPRVEITTERQPGDDRTPAWGYSTVSDTGTGIPPELQDRIFQPNFSTKTSGTGLGLAIVKKAVEDLHGEIGFETEPGVGTTFWIRLPLVE